MEKDTKSTLFGVNPFAKAFAEFDEEAFFDNLHNTVKNKSYFEKYKGFKTTLLWLSYLFNAASALTASYAVFWLTNWITGIAVVGYIVAAISLFFLEKIKRKSSGEFWQVYFFRKSVAVGWLGLSLFCLGLSLASSGFGVKQGAQELAPDPELLKADSMATFYAAEIERLEGVNAELRANKNEEGTTFYKLYNSINANTATITDYRKRAQELEKKTEGQNDKLTADYMAEVDLTAWSLVYLTLLMELLFECCIAYIWYYYHRSYVERNKVQSTLNVQTKAIQTGDTSPTLLELQNTIQLLQAENAALRTPQQAPPPPTKNGAEVLNRTPIGFKSGHMRTHEDTQEKIVFDDRYTVAHTYTKGGQPVTVHYNATMVKSRIGEYERKIAEAETKEMGAEVIENRRKWLDYWQGKRKELAHKMRSVAGNDATAIPT